MDIRTPRGFRSSTAHVGLKETDKDFSVLVSETPATCSAVFTRSRFAGPSVVLSREAVRDGSARGVVVVARNANVATGKQGEENAREVRRAVAAGIGVDEEELLIASTGVIGRQYPMPLLRAHLSTLD